MRAWPTRMSPNFNSKTAKLMRENRVIQMYIFWYYILYSKCLDIKKKLYKDNLKRSFFTVLELLIFDGFGLINLEKL